MCRKRSPATTRPDGKPLIHQPFHQGAAVVRPAARPWFLGDPAPERVALYLAPDVPMYREQHPSTA